MEEISYIGEHLLPGQIGHFLLVLALSSLVLSIGAYIFSHFTREEEQRTFDVLGRLGFFIHIFSIFGMVAVLIHIMTNRYFEYHYVWAHVSDHLPFKYIFSALWEGQEGSFLLWLFWHAVLGLVLIFTLKKWERSVLPVLGSVQFFLLIMILGIYIGDDLKIGSNPFLLFREVNPGIPLFSNPDYLSLIEGKGLNPTLQNYWNIIHPPTTFLGFASVTIPFCFAIAGWIRKEYREWIRLALPWALFSAGALGTGILMGGAWAYEALSFGGYWSWDPVENGILVPWLVLVAGLHGNIIAKSTGQSIKATYVFYSIAFLLTLYSTFLTRSGILGETSAHAFTEMGLETLLVGFVLFYILLTVVIYLLFGKHLKNPPQEESISSREFWMFIGSLVLVFSAALITFTTSIPVWNKLVELGGNLFNADWSTLIRDVPIDRVAHHNRFQIWVAVFIASLTGIAQWLRYKEKNWTNVQRNFFRHIAIQLLSALILSLIFNIWVKANSIPYFMLLFCGLFAVISNLDYLIVKLKTKLKLAASVFAHTGFAIMVIGSLVSGINKSYLTSDPFTMKEVFDPTDERLNKNLYLIKDRPRFIKDYQISYLGDTLIDHNRRYNIQFTKIDEDGETEEVFKVHPYITYNREMTEMANPNPDTKRYLDKDIFSHITGAPAEHISVEDAKNQEDSLNYVEYSFVEQQPLQIDSCCQLILRGITMQPQHKDYEAEAGDIVFGVIIDIVSDQGQQRYQANPMIAIKRGTYIYNYPVQIDDLHLKIRLSNNAIDQVLPSENAIQYKIFELQQGQEFKFHDYQILFKGFDREPSHINYTPEPEDIAVGAILEIRKDETLVDIGNPIFLIRDRETMIVRDYRPNSQLSFQFTNINPEKETAEIRIGRIETPRILSVSIATDVPRSDFIVLEAIVFPGINLFWFGSILMLSGAFLAAYRRWRLNK